MPNKKNEAKFYIYYNLHRKCWSVKYRGKVIAHPQNIVAIDAEFRVSEKGRQRVLREKRKSVHAYVVARSIVKDLDEGQAKMFGNAFDHPVRYNPYMFSTFVDRFFEPIKSAETVWMNEHRQVFV